MSLVFALRGSHGHLMDCAPFVRSNTLIFLCMLSTIAIIPLKLETKCWCSIFDVGPIELSTELHNLPDDKLIVQLLSCNPPVNVDKDTAKLYSEVVIHFIYLLSKTYF